MTSFQLNKNIWKKVKNPGKEGIQKTSDTQERKQEVRSTIKWLGGMMFSLGFCYYHALWESKLFKSQYDLTLVFIDFLAP